MWSTPTSESQLTLTFWVVESLTDSYDAREATNERPVVTYSLQNDLKSSELWAIFWFR